MLNKIKKGLQQPLVKRMAVYALTDGLSRALPFLVMPVIAAYMTPAEFGIASTYMIFTQLIGAFISLSTNSLYSVDYYRTKPEDKARLLSNLMAVNFGITVISMIVVALCTNIVADFFVITLQWQLLGCLMMLFSAIVDMYITYLRMEEKVKLYGRYQILRSVASAALTLLFVAVFFMSWQGRVYALVITNLVTFVLAMITFWKLNLITVKFEKEKIVEAVKFGVPLLPHKLSTWVRGGFDRIMITKKVGISDTGLYSFGGNISNAASLFVTSFFSAYTPYVYKELNLTEEETSNSAAIRAGIVKKCWLSLIGFGIVLILGDIILTAFVKIFFDETYQEAIQYFPYFFIAIFFNFVYNLSSIFVFYSKSTKFLGVITMSVGLVQASCTIPLIGHYGTIGASYALLIGSFLKGLAVFIYGQKVYPMPWFNLFKKK